jgi:peptidyl-prolyl cis-trans isomerase D
MISWIQRTFQQHFKWLFVILLGTVIVSFVFITNTSGGLHQAAPKIPDRPFFDLNLSSTADQQRLMGDTQLSILLQRGSVDGISPDQIEAYAKQRYAALHLAESLGLPNPTQEEIAAHIRSLGAFQGSDGKFDAKLYADFRDRLKTDPRMNEGDVARVMLGDLRFASYRKLLAGPGYVLPADIVEELARSSTRWSLAVATVDASAFAPSIEISDTTLVPWFEANARRFEVPARVSVASVEFLSSQFSAGLTFSDAELRAAYDANPARFPADDKTITAPDALFAAVRAKVETTLRAERSARAALAAASDLAVKLVEQNVKLADLPAFLAKNNLTLTEAGLIGRDIAPASLGGIAAATKLTPLTQRLSADAPYSDPVSTPSGAALLVWRDTIAAHSPALAEVRTLAIAGYREAEQRRLFNAAGRQFRTAVAASVAGGKAFADAVAAAATAASLKAEVKTIAPFTLASPPRDLDFSVFGALEKLPQGGVSEFITTRAANGILVHAIEKSTPPADPTSPAYTDLRTRLGEFLSSRIAASLLESAASAELAKSTPAAP